MLDWLMKKGIVKSYTWTDYDFTWEIYYIELFGERWEFYSTEYSS